MAGGKQPRGRSDPEGAVLASSKSVAPTVSAKSCHANNLKQRSGGRARTPARDKQDAGRGRGRSKSRTHTPARPAQGKSDGAAPISSITVKKGDEDEVSKIGDASAMATRPVSRPKNMNKPGPSRKRSKSREHTRGKSKERGLSKEEKHEQKKRDISQKLKSLELQSSNKKSLTHKNTEAKPLKRGRRPAYEGSRFDCDGMCMVHPRIKLAKKKGDGWKEIHSKCPACSLNESSGSLGLQTDRRDSPKKTTERTTSKEGDEQAYLESANNLRDEGQNARKSRGRMGGFSRPRAFSRGRGKIGAEEQGGNSIARKFSRARSKSRTRRKTETSIGESKDEGEQGSEKKSRMSRVRSMSRSRARADSTVSSGDNDNKTHSFSEAMAKGVKRLGSKGFGLLKKDNTVQSESDIPNKEIPTKEDAAILDSSMAANSVPSGAASAARRHSFDSGRFDEYTAALSDSGRDAYSELRKRSLDRSRGSRSLSPPPAAETRLVVRDDSTYMTFDGTIRSADSRSYFDGRRRRSVSASPPRTGMRRIKRDHSFDSYSRRSGPFDDSSRRSGSSYSRRGDSISPPRNRSPLHRGQSNNRSWSRGPDYLRRGTPPNDSGRQQRYNRRQSGGERRNSFSSRGPGIPPTRSSNRRGIRRNSFRSRSPSPFGSDAGSFRSRRGRSYSRSPSPYERRSSYSESYQGSPRQRYSRHNSLTGSRHQFSRQNSLSDSFRSQEGPRRRNSGPRQSYNRRSSIGRSYSPPRRRGSAGRSYSPPPRRRNSLHDSYNSSSSRDSRFSRSPPPVRGEPRHSRRNSLSPGQRRGGQRRGPSSSRIQERRGPEGGLRRPSSPMRSWSPAANRRPSMHVSRRRSSNGRPLSNGRQLSSGRPMSRGRRPSSNCRPSFDGPPASRGRRPGSDGRPSFDGPPSSRGRRPMLNGRPTLNDRSTSRGRRPMSNGRPISRGRRPLSRPRPGPAGDESFALVVRRNSLSRSPDPVRSSISPGPRPVAPPPDPNEPEIWIACVHQEDDPFENSFATFEEFSVAAGTKNSGRHGTIDRMGSQRSIERMPPPHLSPQSRGGSLSPCRSSFRDRDRSVSPRSLNSLDDIPSNRKSASFHTSQRQKWSEFNEQTRSRANNLTALTQSLNNMSAAGSGRVGVRSKPFAKIDDESMGNSLLDQQSREQRLMGQHNNRPRQRSFHGSEPRGGNLDRSDGSSLHTRRADRSKSHIDMKNVEAALRNIKALQLESRVTEKSDSENHVSVSRRSSAGSGAAPGWANERPTNLHPATTQTRVHQQYSDDQLQRRNSQNIHQSSPLANSLGYREENSFGERRNSLSDQQSPRVTRYHHVADDQSATSLDDYNASSRSFDDDRSNSYGNERNERSFYDDRSNATGNRGSSIGGSSRHSAGRSSSRRSERSFRDDQSNLSGNRSNFTGRGSGHSDVAQFTDIRSNPPPPPPLPHPHSHGSPPASSDYENNLQENNLQEYHPQAQQNHTDQHPVMNQSPGNAGNDNWRQFQVSDSPVVEVRTKGASENQFNDWRKYMVGSDRQKERIASRKGRSSDERNIIQVKQMPFTDRFGDFGYYSGLVNEEGRPNGKGSMKYENGVFYEGMWADGSQDKDAVLQYSRIRGGFSSWSGKGKQASKSGAVLPWNARRNDAHDPSGKTNVRGMEWTDLNGDSGRYTGEVNNDQLPHGKGIMKYGFGLIAEGDWINGVLKEGPQDRLVAGTSMGSGPQSVMGSVMGRNMNMSVGPMSVGPMSVGPMSVDQSTFSRARSIGASSFGMRSIPGMINPMAMSQPGNAQQHAIISQQNAMMRQQMGSGLPMQAAPMMIPQQMMPQQMMPQQMMPQQMMQHQMMPMQMPQMQPQMQMGRLPMQAQLPPGQGGGGQIPRVASQGSIGKPPITEINIK